MAASSELHGRRDASARALEVTEALGRRAIARVLKRLMPLLGLLYVVAYIDRQNVSYAKLQMVDDLGLSEAAYGLGASLFFIGYFLFEVPSNLVLERVGARLWFARIMASWGAITIALGFTQNAAMFYGLRFLLGAAEAGFFPGVLYLLTKWLPQSHQARAVGLFMIASAVANAIGAAIGGALLDLDGLLSLRGWQWVFLATGIPALLLVPVVLRLLPDGPEQARWLPDDERRWLAAAIGEEARAPVGRRHHPLAALADPRVLLYAITFFGFPLAAYGLSYWLPTIVRGFGVSNTVNGLLNVIPWTLVAIALWAVPRWAAGRPWIAIAAMTATGSLALVLSAVLPGDAPRFAALCVAAAAIFAVQPIFWSLPTRILSGPAAAAGLAAINSVGNLGGFVAQAAVPRVRAIFASDLAPLLFLALCFGLAGLLATGSARTSLRAGR